MRGLRANIITAVLSIALALTCAEVGLRVMGIAFPLFYRYDAVLRSMISWVYNRIVRVLFRVRVRDVDCAFKLMRAEVRDKLALETDDFFIDTEIVARARKWNFRIGEKGVRHYPRVAGETTVAPGDVVRTLKTIARMWRRIYMPNESQRAEGESIAGQVVAREIVPGERDPA